MMVLAAAICMSLWLVQAQRAWAHAFPHKFTPSPNAILDTAPSELRMRFTESVVAVSSRITLRAQTGKVIFEGVIPPVDPENLELAMLIPALRRGVYLVDWQVLSAVDGHTTRGSFSFGVGVAAMSDDATPTEQTSWVRVAARWLTLAGLVLVLGLFAFRLCVCNAIFADAASTSELQQLDLSQARVSLGMGGIGLVLMSLGLVLSFIDNTMAYGLFQGGDLRAWLGTRFGAQWVLRLCLTASIGLLLTSLRLGLRETRQALRSWEWWAGLAVSIGLAFTHVLSSHSAAVLQHALRAMAIDFAHVLAAGVWIGGLVYLVACLWQAQRLSPQTRTGLALQLALNFSPLAALAVGAILLSSGYLSWLHVGAWSKLIGTSYGLMLLVKIGLALLTLGLAAVNLLIMKPRLRLASQNLSAPTAGGAMRRFSRLVTCEGILVCLILLAAGVLAEMPRGQDTPSWHEIPGQTTMTANADDLTVALSMKPGVVGQNAFDVYLTHPSGKPVRDAHTVSLRFAFDDASSRPEGSRVSATSKGNGHYVLEGSYISVMGTWTVEVAIRRPERYDVFATYQLTAGPSGNLRSPQRQWIDQWSQRLTWLGGAITGAFLVCFALVWGGLARRAAKGKWQAVAFLLVAFGVLGFGAKHLLTFFTNDYTPMKFIPNPHTADADSVAIGQRLYKAHCMACHGLSGQGRGYLTSKLRQPARPFIASLTSAHSDGDIFYRIQHGMADTAMPAFAGHLSPDDTWHVVNYVRSLIGAP